MQFSLDSLVAFNNDLSAFVRKAKPGAKLATHVYPTFLPEPLYGNRLDVDYCCQTVAWFFQPYWTKERITRYTQVVVGEQAKYFPNAQGIPFIGVYTGRPYCDKSPERFAEELETAWATTASRAFSTCSFDEFVKHPELRAAFLKVAAGK